MKNINIITMDNETYSFEEADLAVDMLGFLVVMLGDTSHFFRLGNINYYNYIKEKEESEEETSGPNVIPFKN